MIIKQVSFVALGLAMVLMSTACIENTNTDSDESPISIEKKMGKPDHHLISQKELDITMQLFDANNLTYDSCQFYGFTEDQYGNTHIACYQFVNNLKVFTDPIFFHFNQSGVLTSLTNEVITGIDFYSAALMTDEDVVYLFLSRLDADDEYFGDKEEVRGGGFVIEYGYYDLNAGTGDSTNNFTMAWMVIPNSTFPSSYINDVTQEIIYYHSGIIWN